MSQEEAELARQGEAREKGVALVMATAQAQAARDAVAALGKARAATEAETKARQAEAEQRRKAEAFAKDAYLSQIYRAQQYWSSDNLAQSSRILESCPIPLRAWEWGYLHGLNHADLLTLPGNGQYTTGIQFSKDGKRLAAFSPFGDAGIRIWDLTTNKPLAEITQFRTQRSFTCFALSPDGKNLALGERTGNISFWDAASGKLVREFVKTARPPYSLSFGANGSKLAAAWADTRNGEMMLPLMEAPRNEDFVVWDVASGKELFHPKGYGFGAEFSPDGSRLVTFKKNTGLRLTPSVPEFFVALFDTAGWTEVAPGQLGSGMSFSFSGNSKLLALGGWDRQRDVRFLRLVDAATGKELFSLAPKAVGDISLSPDGAWLAVCGAFGTNTFDLWDLKTRQLVGTIRGHTESVNAVVFAPDGRLASCAWDKTIKFWDPAAGQTVRQLAKGVDMQVVPARLGPGGDLLAYGQSNASILLLGAVRTATLKDAGTGRILHTLAGHERGTQVLAFSADGTRLCTAGPLGDIKVWDVASGSLVSTYPGQRGTVAVLALSPDGHWAACAHVPGNVTPKEFPVTIRVWNVETGQERWILSGHKMQIHRLAFSSDGRLLASGDYRTTKVWDLQTGKWLRDMNQDDVRSGTQNGLIFSPNGDLLVTAGSQKAQAWNVATGRSVAVFEGHKTLGPDCLAVSPDQTRLATAGDREVKLWDLRSGQEALTLTAPQRGNQQGFVASLAWSKDGQRLRAVFFDASVFEWEAKAP
jgi:WD40 repeat protein